MDRIFPETIRRFWAKVNKTDYCWLWTASLRNKGYGAFGYTTLDGITVQDRAHRFSYQLHTGEIPQGLFVLHRCDTPACVNPDHLFLGTNEDNIKDMLSKGRHVPGGTYCSEYASNKYKRGESHHNAKLTPELVGRIRDRHAQADISYSQLGAMFGITFTCAYKIVKRLSWKHLK